MPQIWDTPGTGFGDIWATLHFLLRKSEAQKQPMFVSRWAGETDMKPRMAEMLSVVRVPQGVSVSISDARPTDKLHMNIWDTRYMPTQTTWSPGGDIATYQFDGRSSADTKNPSPEEVCKFLTWAAGRKLTLVPLGVHFSVAECVRLLARSKFFIGVCSGMSHLAHSVGAPTYLLEYDMKVAWWHGPNPITVCQGVDEFIRYRV